MAIVMTSCSTSAIYPVGPDIACKRLTTSTVGACVWLSSFIRVSDRSHDACQRHCVLFVLTWALSLAVPAAGHDWHSLFACVSGDVGHPKVRQLLTCDDKGWQHRSTPRPVAKSNLIRTIHSSLSSRLIDLAFDSQADVSSAVCL